MNKSDISERSIDAESYARPTAAIRRLVRALDTAAHRRREGAFVAEGDKCVHDTYDAFDCRFLIGRRQWLEEHRDMCVRADAVYCADGADMERMSLLKSPREVIAVYNIPDNTPLPDAVGLVVALDHIQDPGNLGTIIRMCDWMGVRDILASQGTVDVFSPKVVQATMGSIARVRVHYTDLVPQLRRLSEAGIPVYGTAMDGESIYKAELPSNAVIVMGNEGRGMSEDVRACLTDSISIPPYSGDTSTAESLNVAVAASVIVAEWRRRMR